MCGTSIEIVEVDHSVPEDRFRRVYAMDVGVVAVVIIIRDVVVSPENDKFHAEIVKIYGCRQLEKNMN